MSMLACRQAVEPTVTGWRRRKLESTSATSAVFAMWHLFVTTEMRRSEVAALLWRNVDLDTGLLSVTRAAVE
jgi:integrase